jgi:hypothetical protein
LTSPIPNALLMVFIAIVVVVEIIHGAIVDASVGALE